MVDNEIPVLMPMRAISWINEQTLVGGKAIDDYMEGLITSSEMCEKVKRSTSNVHRYCLLVQQNPDNLYHGKKVVDKY